jgi:photosystem II stability/assembly factor-like uncharacterized protein
MHPASRLDSITAATMLAAVLSTLAAGCRFSPPTTWGWQGLASGTDANLRGLHVVDRDTFWASGSGGTVLRSIDGGHTIQILRVAGEPKGELRDIHAFDDRRAMLIACQPARIYATSDGGHSFEKVFEAADDQAFLDAIAFFDPKRGLAFGDPRGDRFQLLRTSDGGRSWQQVDPAGLPPVLEGEGGFAASGTCLAVHPDGRAWIGTGIGAARVFRSQDFGVTWQVAPTPLRHGPSSGVFSVAFRDAGPGLLVGGDYRVPAGGDSNFAFSSDGGATWSDAVHAAPRGYRSCVAPVPGRAGCWIAVGDSGSDFTVDDGQSWRRLGDRGYHVVGFAADGTGFAVGAGGRVARLMVE